jgi:transmembrane sensor
MKSPEHKLTSKNSSVVNLPSDKALKLEAIDLLAQFNTSSYSTLTRKQTELSILSWRNKSVKHEQAWQAAQEMWQLMGDIKSPVLVEKPVKTNKVIVTKYWSKYYLPTSIAACLVMAITLSNILPVSPKTEVVQRQHEKVDPIIEKEFSNYRQEQHKVLLPDNSIVHLNFNSAIKISFSHLVRQVELLKGEAFFKVAKNPKKPFIVKTGNSTASALGTAFIVRLQHDNSSLVTVTEGIVEVEIHPKYSSSHSTSKQVIMDDLTKKNSVVLTANESVSSSLNSLGEVQSITSNNIGSWHRGVLIFKDTPLQKVLAEIDRYTAYSITANLGYRNKEKITGTFFIKRLDQELGALITSLNLAVVDNKKGKLVLGLPKPTLKKHTP